jgi:hypothetical protein
MFRHELLHGRNCFIPEGCRPGCRLLPISITDILLAEEEESIQDRRGCYGTVILRAFRSLRLDFGLIGVEEVPLVQMPVSSSQPSDGYCRGAHHFLVSRAKVRRPTATTLC